MHNPSHTLSILLFAQYEFGKHYYFTWFWITIYRIPSNHELPSCSLSPTLSQPLTYSNTHLLSSSPECANVQPAPRGHLPFWITSRHMLVLYLGLCMAGCISPCLVNTRCWPKAIRPRTTSWTDWSTRGTSSHGGGSTYSRGSEGEKADLHICIQMYLD